jgi:uncharacterized protein (TIGR03083 family)
VTLGHEEIASGVPVELDAFIELIGSLDPTEWTTTSRCAGWTVADVAAHVVGSMADVVAGRVEGLGSPEATAREVAERSGRAPGELADECAEASKQAKDLMALFDDAAWEGPAPGGYDGTLAQGVEALWFDTWAHADDIRAALGRSSVRGAGLRAGIHHVAHVLSQQGWGPAMLELDGIEEVAVEAPAAAGGSATGAGTTDGEVATGTSAARRVTGDPLQFILAATGRADPSALGLDEAVNIYR